ncbi:MAG: hypothetical protein ACTHOH_02330 [Lysobacteraceae bacterium]
MGPVTLPAAIAGIAISFHLLMSCTADPQQAPCDADRAAARPAAVVETGSVAAMPSMPSHGCDAGKRRRRASAATDRCLSFELRFADNEAAIASTGTHA